VPSSSGSARPPDASEIIARAKGGARVAPGSRAATAHGDPAQVYRRYEQAADPQWEQFQSSSGTGTHPADVMGMIDIAGGDAAAADLMSAGPYEAIPIYEDPTGTTTRTSGEYFREESTRYLEDEGFYDKIGYGYSNMGTAPSTSLVSSVGTGPADITQSPTSTTNPARPRTVAAGYDSSRKVLTTIFRDGTFYNYYGVSSLEWGNFKRARSKGRFIRLYLDHKTRGTASMGAVPEAHQELLYKVARTTQAMRGGYQKGQKAGSKRGGRGMYGSKNTAARKGRKLSASVEKTMGRYT
jgi:hypothetical protein